MWMNTCAQYSRRCFRWDYYPFQFQSSIKTTSDLWRDLGYLRKRAKETGIPHWHYFQAINGSDSLTVEQIRVQMSAALAYGVKGLSYYNSWNSLTNTDGSPTANYEALKTINWQARRVGDLLYDKQNIAIHHTGLSAGYDSTYYLDPLSASPYIASAPDNLIIGVFSDGDNIYLAIANKDHTSGRVRQRCAEIRNAARAVPARQRRYPIPRHRQPPFPLAGSGRHCSLRAGLEQSKKTGPESSGLLIYSPPGSAALHRQADAAVDAAVDQVIRIGPALTGHDKMLRP